MSKKTKQQSISELKRDFDRRIFQAAAKRRSESGFACFGSPAWGRPHASDALGVSPDQIPSAVAELRKYGVMAEFNKEGQCLVSSDKQFQDVARATGMKTGRDGYETTGYDGQHMLTGRRPVQERNKFKQIVQRMAEGDLQ